MDKWTEQEFVLSQKHEQLLVVYFFLDTVEDQCYAYGALG